jgi:PAS domain S-box-containing protein
MSGRLATDLRRAIAADEIVPWFQPLVELRTGRLAGFEVLARWRHAVRGLVHPSAFIPVAEQSGLIGALTQRVLSGACRAAAAWPDHLKLSVNLSPLQLSDRALPEQLRTLVEETGFPFRRLIFEVTESVLIGNHVVARSVAQALKALGASLALDDFGTGYANMAQLRALPFDRLKIDASLVRPMCDQREYRQIVASIVGLGHSLGMVTIAEGVERQIEADMLTSLGCDIGQGWLFSPPVPAAQVPAILATQHAPSGPPLARIAEDVAHRLEAVPGQSLSQLRALYDNAPVGLGLLDTSLHYVALNRRLAAMHHSTVAAHLGRSVAEMLPANLYAQLEPHLRQALNGEAVFDFESLWRGPDGGDHVLLASYQPVHDAAGEVAGVSVAVVDMTERNSARRARGDAPARPVDTTGLTQRQAEVLELVAVGRSAKEIARHLGIGVGTVKTHLSMAFRRLGVRNRIEAIRAAGLTRGETGNRPREKSP